jgi:hypothetical protein
MYLSAQQRPLAELEAAHELAEALLTDHKTMLPDELAAHLASFHSDLTVIIEDRCGVGQPTTKLSMLSRPDAERRLVVRTRGRQPRSGTSPRPAPAWSAAPNTPSCPLLQPRHRVAPVRQPRAERPAAAPR